MSSFTDNMNTCTENPKESTGELLMSIRKIINVAECKNQFTKSVHGRASLVGQ